MPNQNEPIGRKPSSHTVHESADGLRIAPGPYIGKVKANMDRKRSGRLQVYIPELGGDPTDEACWKGVDYVTPFYGFVPPPDEPGPPHSYGFWFVPPDIGCSVMCIFANGDPNRGYYFGVVPEWPAMHMVPGISQNISVPSLPKGGDEPWPVIEWDYKQAKPPAFVNFYEKATTPHEVQTAIWDEQGILWDLYRYTGTSSAFRESPSRVYGISTPGPPISRDPIIKPYGPNHETQKIYYEQRKGGHRFVMDDGDIDGDNWRMKLRSSKGHMILMNDVDEKEFIYVINHNGKAWLEIDREGDIYVYSQRDIKITAMRDMFIEVKRHYRLEAGSIDVFSHTYHNTEAVEINSLSHYDTKMEAKNGFHIRAGTNVWMTADQMVNIWGKELVIIVGGLVLINSGGEEDAGPATPAILPDKMPRHEPWPYHISNVGDTTTDFGTIAQIQAAENAAAAKAGALNEQAIAQAQATGAAALAQAQAVAEAVAESGNNPYSGSNNYGSKTQDTSSSTPADSSGLGGVIDTSTATNFPTIV